MFGKSHTCVVSHTRVVSHTHVWSVTVSHTHVLSVTHTGIPAEAAGCSAADQSAAVMTQRPEAVPLSAERRSAEDEL